jgi:EmrB/QacA subfamily drug resistance transporter
VGGPLIDLFSWRSIFLLNLPVGIVGLGMAMVFVKESVSEKPTINFDIMGAITLGVCLSALVLVLDKGSDWGWLSLQSILSYVISAGFAIIFYTIERKHPEPIVDFKFFRISAFTGTLLNNFIIFMGMMGGVFLIPVFAQTFLGYDATQTGYLFMPMAFSMVIAAPLGAKLVGRVQPKYVIAASTFVAGLGIFLFTGLDPRSSALDIIIPIMVMALGMGFGMSQRTTIIASAVPVHEIGIASSILALARNISGAFGIAIFATILNNSTENNLIKIARNSVVNTADPLIRAQAAALMILKAQVDAYHTVFIVASLVLFAGALLALTLNVKERKSGVEVFVEA